MTPECAALHRLPFEDSGPSKRRAAFESCRARHPRPRASLQRVQRSVRVNTHENRALSRHARRRMADRPRRRALDGPVGAHDVLRRNLSKTRCDERQSPDICFLAEPFIRMAAPEQLACDDVLGAVFDSQLEASLNPVGATGEITVTRTAHRP